VQQLVLAGLWRSPLVQALVVRPVLVVLSL
jgi:hypothetical protein